MKSIAARILLYLTVTVLIICTGLGTIAYYTASKTVITNLEHNIITKAEDSAQLVASNIKAKNELLSTVAVNQQIESMDWGIQLPELIRETERLGLLYMGVADLDGHLRLSNGQETNIADREYFRKALSGFANVSDPLVNKIDNSIIIVCAAPIRDSNGVVTGVLTGMYDGTELSNIISSIKFGRTGYAFLIDKEGTVIAHPDTELVINQENFIKQAESNKELESLADFIRKMVAGEKGSGEYKYDGILKDMGYTPVEGTSWSLAVTSNRDEFMEDLDSLQKGILIASIIFILIGIGISLFVGRQLSRPIHQISECAGVIAGGDFTSEVSGDLLARQDEIGGLGKSFETLRTNLSQMVKHIADTSQEVAAASEELAASGENIAATMEEISASTEEIAAGMQEVSSASEEVNASGQEVGAALCSVSNEVDEENQNAEKIQIKALDIQKQSRTAQENAVGIYENIKDKLVKAVEDARVVEQISGLAQNIAGIADQTNLLALNAAIEAARAGEQGKGFAVVAEEVRKLAEDSALAVDEIQTLTRQVQEAIGNLINNSNEILQFVNEEVVKDYNFMVEVGEQYKGDAANVAGLTERVNSSIKQVLTSMQEIQKAIESTTATIEQSTAGAQEIAKGTENAAHAASDISQASRKMAENAEKLNNLIRQFKI